MFLFFLLCSAPKVAENKNMKRESKTYSYKEQLLEKELKRELESKKKKEDTGGVIRIGDSDITLSPIPKELSKKQRELVNEELAKEAAIREKLLKVSSEMT